MTGKDDTARRHGLARRSWSSGLIGLVLLQGCAMPRSGPMFNEVVSSPQRGNINLIPVTPDLADAGHEAAQASFPAAMQGQPDIDFEQLGPGDRIDVTVWERDGFGLFSGTAGGPADLGEMEIDKGGRIYLPYAGAVPVAGLTAAGARDAIAKKLSRLLMSPQIGVRIVDHQSRTVTVQGDVTKPGAFPIDRGMVRLSGLLGLAAPNQQNPEQLAVSVRRGTMSATVRLSDIYRDPKQDIALRGGDSVVVHAVVQHLTILGAAGVQGRILLSKRNFTVMDALGEARGLADATADPRAVFLFRTPDNPVPGDGRPTIYQFDMRQPETVFLANRFVVRDGDAILISTAPFAQTQKVLSAFSATLGSVRSAAVVAP